jgi:hypothetical protein
MNVASFFGVSLDIKAVDSSVTSVLSWVQEKLLFCRLTFSFCFFGEIGA